MNSFHKSLLASICVFTTSVVLADKPSDKSNMKMQTTQPANTAPMMCHEITPTASPKTDHGARFFITGDFIYWQAQEDDLAIASSGFGFDDTITVEDTFPVDAPGKVKNIDFGYEPGFKFGIGVDFQHDGWDTYMNYTWLKQSNATASILDNPSEGFLYGLSNPNTPDASVSGTWGLYFNNIDWELGRNFYISKRLTLRPHVGIKGSWSHQRFNTYEIALDDADTLYTTTQKQTFWGVGLRAGLNTQWHFVKWFSIYGDLALAELAGQFYVKNKVVQDDGVSAPETIDWQTNNIHRVKPVLELALGFRTDVDFGEDGYYHFFAQVGWEQQIWWDQNQFLDLFSSQGGGNLTFQGLDVKVGFTF